MKLHKCFMVMAAMVALMLPCDANEAVQAAAKTAAENMTGKNIAKLYKVRTEAENPDQREVIIQACIAGLYAIGDTKNAKKINQGENRDGFIDSLMKECDLCHGEGRSQEGCYKCKGSGACQNRKCNNGTVTTAGFDGRSNARKCSNCGGSGKCANCKGNGKVARTCSRCNGSKMAIDKAIALVTCKDKLNALIAGGSEIPSRNEVESNTQPAEQNAQKEKRQLKQAEESVRLAQQKADSERHACAKSEGDVRLAQQNDEFKKDLEKINSERKCFGDGCEIDANGLSVIVLKRKSGDFNYVVAGMCNGVSNTRLYYKWNGWTQTENVDWEYDFNYMILSDEREWTNWMDALKAVHAKVIEWVDLAAKNDIDKVEKEIPIGGIEVFAHNNLITKGKGQRELYMSATRKCVLSDTPVKFFCKLSSKDEGKYYGEVAVRCGYFEHEILRFSGDKTCINNDISLMIERYNPAALKKAYLEHARKQDMFK